jgi:eukaryotic-like serine/threonine-protein kinase
MPLSPGDKLGPYEILAVAGKGGMGEVYKARDTRLDRIVAIKTSKVEFSERFEREAKAVAALNHSNICQLYDVGPNYLVMEYIEGTPLKGPLPVDQALKYAVQICDALDAAHKKGITHRDLKPANILVTKAGIKLLDFGLAKLGTSGIGQAAKPPSDATLTMALTGKNEIVGTLLYMSPEQLQSKDADARSDIFSFGCVLYEMLTGKRAFDGGNAASIIAAILERPAPSVASVAPAALDRTLQHCLAKDPDDRWQSARDLKAELVWIAGGGIEVPRQAQARPASKWIWGAAVLVGAVVAAFAVWMLKPVPAKPISRTVIALGPDERLANLNNLAVAISPDGANVVYVATRGGGRAQLFLRRLDALKAEPVAGTEDAVSPFFSSDSQWIAFFAGGKLKKVAVAGGAPVTLYDAITALGGTSGTWSPNNNILFASAAGLVQVPASGGAPRNMTVQAQHAVWGWPQFLPGGGAVVFASSATGLNFANNSSISATVLGGAAAEKDLIAGGTAPRLAATGDLIYAQNGTLMAVPFDSKRLALAGSPAPVLDGVRESRNGAVQYGLSANGTLVYVAGGFQASSSRLAWVSREGKEQPIAASARDYNYPRLSPDEQRIAVYIAPNNIWLYDIGRDALSRATFTGTINTNPVWSPDGKRLAFTSNLTGSLNLFWQPADGSGTAERLTANQFINVPTSFSPDGQTIAFLQAKDGTGFDIWTLSLGDGKARPFLATQHNESAPRFSPDGHWLAYVSDESGRWEVYVQPYPGPGGKWQVSTDGGAEPAWNPAGRELFYRAGNRMMAAPVTFQPGFSAGKPVVLFDGPWLPSPLTTANYDVSRDGQRFLMLKSADDEDQGARQIVMVQNWLEELKQSMAAGKK